MDQQGAYGAGKSGEAFNMVDFIKKPKTILRLTSWLFSLIVFACIISEGPDRDGNCIFGEKASACHFAVAIGVMAFITATVFFIFDLVFPSISSASKRKKVVMVDLGTSGLWAFLYFVGFCLLVDTWRKKEGSGAELEYGADNARAAIAFSFFSIFTWAGLAYYALQAYRQGTLSAFAPSYDQDQDQFPNQSSAPYKSYPGTGDMMKPYQQGPFSNQESTEGISPPQAGNYDPPSY